MDHSHRWTNDCDVF